MLTLSSAAPVLARPSALLSPSATSSYVTLRQVAAAAERAQDGDGEFVLQFPLPLVNYTSNGEPQSSSKSEWVHSVLTGLDLAVTYPVTDLTVLRRHGANITYFIDFSPFFYRSLKKGATTYRLHARGLVRDALGPCVLNRSSPICIAVFVDIGRVAQKAFTDKARGHGDEVAADAPKDGDTPMPTLADYDAFKSNRNAQASIWLLIEERPANFFAH